MKSIRLCPNCKTSKDGAVIDCRDSANSFRRRRSCLACGTRWTTYEVSAADFEKLKGDVVGLNEIKAFLTSAAALPENVRKYLFQE